MGLDHPGGNNDDASSYAFVGTDVDGHEVKGPSDLMGYGSDMHPYYFYKWAIAMDLKYGFKYRFYVADH